MDQQGKAETDVTANVRLAPTEHAFYLSGWAWGRAEALGAVARDLKAAIDHYLSQYQELAKHDRKVRSFMPQIEIFLGHLKVFAEQVDANVKPAQEQGAQHFKAAIDMRDKEEAQPVHRRLWSILKKTGGGKQR